VGEAKRRRERVWERDFSLHFFDLVQTMFNKDKKAREGLDALNREFERLEHNFKMLKLEWEESYEKIASMLRKLGRREEALQKEMDGGRKPLSPEEEALRANMSDDQGEGEGSATPQGRMLTPRQRAIQQQVLRRRAGITQ
jgi:uncharacterized membrane-anchored protein YhcB (DUF1043 family)